MENTTVATVVQLDDEIYRDITPFPLAVFLVVVIPVWIVNVVGNALVLVCVFRDKKLHRPSYYLVGALSLADISYPLLGFGPMTYALLVHSPHVCTARIQYLLMATGNILVTVSFFTLLLLTAERHCSIAFPIFHRKVVTNRRISAAVVCLWFCSAAATIVMYPFARNDTAAPLCGPFSFEFAGMVCGFGFIGLVGLSFLNGHLLFLLRKRTRKIVERQNLALNGAAQNSVRNDIASTKATKTVTIVVTFFILCWLPATTCCVFEFISYKLLVRYEILEIGRRAFVVLFTINGAINPVVYARQNPHFRAAFRKILGRETNQVSHSEKTSSQGMSLNAIILNKNSQTCYL